MDERTAVIVSAVRTPIGDFGGAFKEVKAGDLSAVVMKEAVARVDLDPGMIDDIIWGCCIQDFDEPNVGRCGALKAGFPVEVPAYTIQRQCNSGMQAAINASMAVRLGEADIIVCGGVESYSTAPYVFREARWGARLMHKTMEDSIWSILYSGGEIIMGETAELIAKKWNITREESDEVAVRSHNNAEAATKSGRFTDEIVPVVIPGKKGEQKTVERDEHIRMGLTLDEVKKLRPVFRKDGIVTAASASGINDGAAAMVVMSFRKARELGLTPLAKLGDYAVAGVEPNYMGEGPIPATKKLFEKSSYALADVGLIEMNEAFAAQYIACERGIGFKRELANVNGSGCGLGHPVGCTGTRIIVSLIYEMKRRGIELGLASLCAGGGMGTSILIENC
ncbi:MAG: thiolase family protein [Deltaproteobacteria bacterium]|nr:thiolase family protein [Deltaproteobacteria bacterium]